MALSPLGTSSGPGSGDRRSWDLTHLATKYPWLRVDAETIAEFRSPFQWVDAPPPPKNHDSDLRSARGGGDISDCEDDEERDESVCFSLSVRRQERGGDGRDERAKAHRRPPRQKPPSSKRSPGTTSAPVPHVSSTNFTQKSAVNGRRAREPGAVLLAMPEAGPLDGAAPSPVSRPRRKQRKKRHNVLSLRFPILTRAAPTTSASDASAPPFAKQLRELADAEQKLKDRVSSQIAAEKARLPLAFLFERNLDRHYCRETGVRTISRIFSKLQHRLLFAAFERWGQLVATQQAQERSAAALERAQAKALAFFERLASDAYVGTLARAFTRWHADVRDAVARERHRAVTIIQTRFRQRRASVLLRGLRQAAADTEFRRARELQQLLRFEAYGRAMQWNALRNGFDLLLQHHCARQIQALARRFQVQRRVGRRLERKRAAVAIQSAWRRVLAKKQLAARRELRRVRQALEARAATTIQARARTTLARRQAKRRREWRTNEHARAAELQRSWRKHRARLALHARFAARRELLDAERAALERQQAAARLEQLRIGSALAIERVYRGFRGRCVFRTERAAQRLELAVRRVQTSWRRSTGRYALQLRFSAQRERIDAERQRAALRIQCCVRGFLARRSLAALRREQQRRQRAAVAIQRVVRGRKLRVQFRRQRRATVAIQSGVRQKLARRERQRRLDEKIARYEQLTAAAALLQRWVRGVFARRRVRHLRDLRAREEALARGAAVLIQKRARGADARRTAGLLREAAALIELEQRRHFPGSERAASPLLQFMTEFYVQRRTRAAGDTDAARFTREQSDWVREKLRDARQQIAREDAAAVFLQRRFRGVVARVDLAVRKLRAKQRRELEAAMAARLQRHTRGFLARRRVARLRQQRRLEELKCAYIRERRWQAEQQHWTEQFQREQVELQVRKAAAVERELREAKRDAELARFHAEVAALRRQELRTQQERAAGTQSGPPVVDEADGGELLVDGWVETADELGNVFFYHASTFESSWERPTRAQVASVVESPKSDAEPSADVDMRSSPEQQPEADGAKTPEVEDSTCSTCRRSPATKQCVDCGGAAFCASCFVLAHFSSPAASKQAHDFVLLRKAAPQRARCQSRRCRAPDAGDASLASYFCGECVADAALPTPPELPATDTVAQQQLQSPGCFFCESCFQHAHESALALRHVAVNALHFRTGTTLCCDCAALVATRACEQCGDAFCAACFERLHARSRKTREHAWTALEILKDELASASDAYCAECDVRRAAQLCNLCGDGFCAACFAATHAKGRKQQHTWVPWESVTQAGDWLEIRDEHAGATIYFNVETKESSTQQPLALKSGAERHQAQLREREQLQKRKALEIESELVRLREQVRELQEKEARPLSRALRSAGGSGGATASGIVRGQQAADTTASRAPERAKRRGLIGRLFSRSTKAAAGSPNDGLTPDEHRRNELIRGIRADEQALVASRLTTRSREEKEAKAAETLGTKQFEDAILRELTKT